MPADDAARVLRHKVRGFGYGVIHLADVPEDRIGAYTSFGAPFHGVKGGLVALCGNRVRAVSDQVVLMNAGSKVSCRHCLRATP